MHQLDHIILYGFAKCELNPSSIFGENHARHISVVEGMLDKWNVNH